MKMTISKPITDETIQHSGSYSYSKENEYNFWKNIKRTNENNNGIFQSSPKELIKIK
jgi:hypothetical protein